jgi:hypothetical protein
VVVGYRDPVRLVVTGFSTSDSPSDDNGDIYVIGTAAGTAARG